MGGARKHSPKWCCSSCPSCPSCSSWAWSWQWQGVSVLSNTSSQPEMVKGASTSFLHFYLHTSCLQLVFIGALASVGRCLFALSSRCWVMCLASSTLYSLSRHERLMERWGKPVELPLSVAFVVTSVLQVSSLRARVKRDIWYPTQR